MLPYGSRRNSCIVVVCPRIADPWTNHDQAGDATGFFWGDTTAAVAYSFSVRLARGFASRAVAGPTMSSSPQTRHFGTVATKNKRHPQSSRRCPFLSSRGEDVKPWMMWMMKTSMYYSQSMISSTQKTRITVSTRSIKYFHYVTSSRILYGRRGSQTLCQIRLIYCSTEQV